MTQLLPAFAELWLSEKVLQALDKKGFKEPSPIQAAVIPLLLSWETDIIGQAQTGTGKTAAFGLPLIEKVDTSERSIQAIVLTPTRELAVQVAAEIQSLSGDRKLSVVTIYGGQSITRQISALRKGAHIVVGTPGRVIDHLKRKTLKLEDLKFFVLDEADEMLNMGFVDDIKEILSHADDDARMLFFSATMPKEILQVAGEYMGDYKIIRTKAPEMTKSDVDQMYIEVQHRDRFEALTRVVDLHGDFYGIVFCVTKRDTDDVAAKLKQRGYDADAIHGDLSQQQRERVLWAFKKKTTTIMVATDVAARGIDVDSLSHVVNFSLPQDVESYVHRIWRTGRAGRKGIAVTLMTPHETRKMMLVKRITKADIRKETLPSGKEMEVIKKQQLKDKLQTIITNEDHSKYMELATELLGEQDPIHMIAALMKHGVADELEGSYKDLGSVQSMSMSGTARLFIAAGRNKGYGAKEIVDLIKESSDIADEKINDVKVLDEFSFVTVPMEDAELILHHFDRNKQGWRSIVSRAKDDRWGGGGRRSGWGGWGYRRWGWGGNRSGGGSRRR